MKRIISACVLSMVLATALFSHSKHESERLSEEVQSLDIIVGIASAWISFMLCVIVAIAKHEKKWHVKDHKYTGPDIANPWEMV